MEAMVAARDPAPEVPPKKLLREPLSWATLAAFAGVAVGLAWVAYLAAWFGDPYGPSPPPTTLVWLAGSFGELLVALSLLGLLPLLAGFPSAARALRAFGVPSVALLLLLFLGSAAYTLVWSLSTTAPPGATPAPLLVYVLVSPCLVVLCVVPFIVAAFLGARPGLGALLGILCALAVPHLFAWRLVSGGDLGAIPEDVGARILLGGLGMGVSVLEAPLWALFGIVLFRAARVRARGGEFRAREKANLRAARRLYEEALGADDASVLNELVPEDFHDPRRAFSALRRSYPDLAVSVEGQEAEGDLVRTRLRLTGTDEGGVMWYPPTGRRVSFGAEFVDRFSGGLLVEHAREADTEDLLGQLGHHEED